MKAWQVRADALWLGLLAVYVLAGARVMPFHGDESTLIYMGRDYFYLAEGDWARLQYDPAWAISPAEQHLRLLNGTISKTVYGAVAASMGYRPQTLNEQWAWHRDYAGNAQQGRFPDADLLAGARLASSAQLALAAACFFLLIRMTLGRPTAYLASAMFALHPNILINGRRAMMEGSHLLGIMVVLLAGAWLLQERRWTRYALLGVCMGFALAAKHPTLTVCAAVTLAVAVAPAWRLLRHSESRAIRDLAGLALAGVLAIAVFLLLNPAWWNAISELPPLVLDLRADMLQGQVEAYGGYTSFGEQVAGFFQFVFVGERQYFEVAQWTSFEPITAQIAAYEGSGWAGALFIGESGRLGLVCLLLAAAGVVSLGRDSRALAEHRLLLLLWMGVTALVTLVITPLPWARYYLALLPALMLLLSQALVGLAGWLRRNTRTRGYGVAGLA